MDANRSWCVSELLADDCEEAWLHPGWEDVMQKWYDWLCEEVNQKKVSQMIKSTDGSAGLLHKITEPTAWRGGVQILKKEEEDARPLASCEEKRKEWAKHWQCGMEVQKQEVQKDKCHQQHPAARDFRGQARQAAVRGCGPRGLISLEHGRSTARSEFTRPCAKLRSKPLCPRNDVAVPTNLPQCPACACGQQTTLRGPRWRSSRASAPHRKTVRQRSGLAVTEEWRPGRDGRPRYPWGERAAQRRLMVGYG